MKIRVEEYIPAAGFLQISFNPDRAELATRFAEFTPAYETAFAAQIDNVKALEQAINRTAEQRNDTHVKSTNPHIT